MVDTRQELSSLITRDKYAKRLVEEGRRETWDETVDRYGDMLAEKFADNEPVLAMVEEAREALRARQVAPSMRGYQFAGRAIQEKNARFFNCAFAPLNKPQRIAELTYLLLCGSGTGFSVQEAHTSEYDWTIREDIDALRVTYIIPDSIEGWADSVLLLLEGYLAGEDTCIVDFDYSEIRAKNTLITSTNAPAPGPEPLKEAHEKIRELLISRAGQKLRSIDLHDVMCHASTAVVAGGVRRSAMISLFDAGDELMLTAKAPANFDPMGGKNSQRALANNTQILPRSTITYETFEELMDTCHENGGSEPGAYFANNPLWGVNPCNEAALRPFSFCNLTSINSHGAYTQEEFERRARIAATIGTLQASYTDFSYLSPEWKETTDEDALIGVSITGVGLGTAAQLDLVAAAQVVRETNERVAKLIGINTAARTTLVKPEGTTSLVFGVPFGVSAAVSRYCIRRVTIPKDDALYPYFQQYHPELLEQSMYNEKHMFLNMPLAFEDAVVYQDEETLSSRLERVRRFNVDWTRAGHNRGDNTHNVSCTIYYCESELEELKSWMWENRNNFNGMAFFKVPDPVEETEEASDDNTFSAQMIWEPITKERYDELVGYLRGGFDYSKVKEVVVPVNLAEHVACGAGGCEVNIIGGDSEKHFSDYIHDEEVHSPTEMLSMLGITDSSEALEPAGE